MKRQPKHCVDIKELRRYAMDLDCFSINDIANRTHIDRNTISSVLNGKMYPSSCVMGKFIDGLNIPLDKAGKIFFAEKLS